MAVALTLRLVFEVNLFIGYFAAVSATLLVLACASGTPRRWRRWLLAWAGWNVVVAAAYGGNSWRSVVQGVASGVALQVLVVGWAMALAVVPLAVGSWRGARRREDPPPAKEPSEAPSGSDLLGFSGRS